ncbi:MAG: nitrate/nitrite transporter NrtS [Rhodospirillaceae bacterium]|jgi:hypothetical protein|nr:nitrate/nitrite transporter NrtS [Rhodospirillaceae bacterium]
MGDLRFSILNRGVFTSLVVGTALIAINHWSVVSTGGLPPTWQMTLTYLVPFLVSVTSSHMTSHEHANAAGANTVGASTGSDA